MRMASKLILLSLLLFSKDYHIQAQTVSYCVLLATERSIDSTDFQLKEILEENWKLIELQPDHSLHYDVCLGLETYSPAFLKGKLSRPSEFEAQAFDCSKSAFSIDVHKEYTDLLVQTNNELIKADEHRKLLHQIPDLVHAEIKEVSFGVDPSILSGKTIVAFNNSFTCILVDPYSNKIKLEFLVYPSINPASSFKTALDSVKNILALMNAGMFDNNLKPQGLFVRNGRKIKTLNMDRKTDGNFYMDPAGVFLIDKLNQPRIMTREAFSHIQDSISIKNATQSGPMLLIDGQIHPMFKANSQNLHIRNGVGITSSGKLVFIISNRPVNFYQFALVFKKFFGCQNALFLDGAISKVYAPAMGRKETDGRFGPMIAITKTNK